MTSLGEIYNQITVRYSKVKYLRAHRIMKQTRKIKEHTCINNAPKAACDASSLIDPTQTRRAAQSTKANP